MKLMIVAHPDDEVLFGGGLLLGGDWFVICMTNGSNKIRRAEFENVMDVTKSAFLMLDHPDIKEQFNKKHLTNDIRTILNSSDWSMVVTHGPNGEYGHQHHIQIHEAVNEIVENLWCFDFNGPLLSDAIWQNKLDLINIYESQAVVCKKFIDGKVLIRNECAVLVNR